jgi:nicotinamidase-related amidase
MSTTPFQPVAWDLEPGRTALVIIDPQNDFLHNEGHYAKKGVDISHMQRTIEPTKALVAEARAQDIPVIWTRHGFRDPVDGGWIVSLRPFLQDGGLREDTWGWEVLSEFDTREEDRYVNKNRLSAFFQSNLELLLHASNALTVIFCGVLTNQCVASTTKDAMFRDFKPIVVEEATGTTLPHLHAPALEMMQVGWAEVRNLEDTLAGMRALSPAAVA